MQKYKLGVLVSAVLLASCSTMAGVVPAGANTTFHSYTSAPGTPASASVGTSGRMAERLALVTASARSLPP